MQVLYPFFAHLSHLFICKNRKILFDYNSLCFPFEFTLKTYIGHFFTKSVVILYIITNSFRGDIIRGEDLIKLFLNYGKEVAMDKDIEQMMNTLDNLLETCDKGIMFTEEELMNTGIFESVEEIEVFFTRIGDFYSTWTAIINNGGGFRFVIVDI